MSKKQTDANEPISPKRTKAAIKFLIENGIVEVIRIEPDGTKIYDLTTTGRRLHEVQNSGNKPD